MANSLTLDPMPVSHEQARRYDDEFMELLKGAEAPETNEKDTRKDKAEVYVDPRGRPAPGSIDAPWGVNPNPASAKPPSAHFSDAFKDIYHDTRQGVVDRSLSGAGAAAAVAQKTIAENLAHGASGDFVTRALLLKPKSKEKLSHDQSLTLSEQVRNVLK